MRTFIAIELPQEIRESLAQLQDRLKQSHADVKWVDPQNIHLTLKFLGEIDAEQLDKIIRVLEQVCLGKKTFQMRLSSIGAFPKMHFPRVLWVSVDKGESETKEIAAELEEKVSIFGVPKEKRSFSSHITIGRVRSNLFKDKLVNDLKMIGSLEGKEFAVTELTLFKSTLTPKGAAYEALKTASLKAT
ncbi:MAG: RNA 2',3'-cyclic phosphodiesterase [Candidatus Omnitrophota bacterium]